MKQNYSQAIVKMLEAGNDPEVVLARVKKLLATKKESRLWPKVVRESLALYERNQKRQKPKLTLVREAKTEAIEKQVKSLTNLSLTDCEVRYDESLVDGFTLKQGHRYTDASYKTTLLKLYQKIMST